jgi:hypothetical protein
MTKDEMDKFLNAIRLMGNRPMYMDKFGRPLSLMEWATLSEDLEYKRINYTELAETSVHPASHLSTVWLGLDHNFWPQGPPLIFETMRFVEKGELYKLFGKERELHPSLEFPDPDDNTQTTEQVRWSTEEQARLGHARIVRLIQELEMQ